jgi:hypothetical protein
VQSKYAGSAGQNWQVGRQAEQSIQASRADLRVRQGKQAAMEAVQIRQAGPSEHGVR